MTRRRIRDLIPITNPVLLASGPPGSKAAFLIRHGQHAGGLVAKSITVAPRPGSEAPRIARLDDWGMINWEGFPNPGLDVFVEELREAIPACPCPVIGSVAPLNTPEEMVVVARALVKAGVAAIEMDFKWDYGGAARVDFEATEIYQTISLLKRGVDVPVFAKLSPGVRDITEGARAAEAAGADGISAINTLFPAMKINLKRREPAISKEMGGLSGRAILPLAVAAVYQIYRAVDIPIMGIGGVTTGEDALELIMAGADCVQICTQAMLEGPTAFRRINKELTEAIERYDLPLVEECVGLAHRR